MPHCHTGTKLSYGPRIVTRVFTKKGAPRSREWSILGAVFEDGTAMAWGEATSFMARKHREIVEI